MSTDPKAPSPAPFASLGLSDELVTAASRLGYTHATAVQEGAIPAALLGFDLWASAKTGSGKTAAFVLPMLQMLGAARNPRQHPRPVAGLILTPTRELAAQVGEVIDALGSHMRERLKTCVAVGGVSINPQMLALRGGADVVVATPGRLLDLVEHNALALSDVRQLVLDEADRLLSLGFADELTRICALLPVDTQKLLFSATFPPAVRALADRLLHNAIQINIDAGALPDISAIAQRAIEVDEPRRNQLLQHLVRTNDWPSTLVFVATKHAAVQLSMKLRRAGFRAGCLHGELSQGARTEALEAFKARRLQILVATDLASRGLDIESLPAVVNFDLPRSPTDYLHRVGRTGRAGESGVAITFVNAATDPHLRLIERRHHISLAREVISGFEPSGSAVPPANPHGGIKGRRKSKKDKLREAAAAAQQQARKP